jgi:hypothetical protein
MRNESVEVVIAERQGAKQKHFERQKRQTFWKWRSCRRSGGRRGKGTAGNTAGIEVVDIEKTYF